MTKQNKAVGRFAPSPTGFMHLGNARSALLAWLQIRSRQGHMILRIEDIDRTRVRDYAYDAIKRDLEWLGLDWDQEFIQSKRSDAYAAAIEQLQHYECVCTRKEIREAASAPHGKESIYPGLCRHLNTSGNTESALRWRIPQGSITAQDRRLGRLSQVLEQDVGDFVLRRKDGCYAYHLAVVVDDGLMGITEILRGEDLWPSTPRQIALQKALAYATPHYLHVPLMRNFRGERLAKRDGAPPLKSYREAGEDPRKILAELALSLGWQVPQCVNAQELCDNFGEELWQDSVRFAGDEELTVEDRKLHF